MDTKDTWGVWPHNPMLKIKRDGTFVKDARGKLYPLDTKKDHVHVPTGDSGSSARLNPRTCVADTFLMDKPQHAVLEYIDGDRLNNHADNLRWGSQVLTKTGVPRRRAGQRTSLPVEVVDKDGTIIEEFVSIREASRATGIHHIKIGNHIKSGKEIDGLLYRRSEFRFVTDGPRIENEAWRFVPGLPYDVSNHFRLRHKKGGHLLKRTNEADRYSVNYIVSLKGKSHRINAVKEAVKAFHRGDPDTHSIVFEDGLNFGVTSIKDVTLIEKKRNTTEEEIRTGEPLNRETTTTTTADLMTEPKSPFIKSAVPPDPTIGNKAGRSFTDTARRPGEMPAIVAPSDAQLAVR